MQQIERDPSLFYHSFDDFEEMIEAGADNYRVEKIFPELGLHIEHEDRLGGFYVQQVFKGAGVVTHGESFEHFSEFATLEGCERSIAEFSSLCDNRRQSQDPQPGDVFMNPCSDFELLLYEGWPDSYHVSSLEAFPKAYTLGWVSSAGCSSGRREYTELEFSGDYVEVPVWRNQYTRLDQWALARRVEFSYRAPVWFVS